jgi:hypothetical protein
MFQTRSPHVTDGLPFWEVAPDNRRESHREVVERSKDRHPPAPRGSPYPLAAGAIDEATVDQDDIAHVSHG